MIAFKAKSLGLSVAQARLAGTPSRIPTAATMTWRMPLPGAAALSKFGGYDTTMSWVSGDDDDSGDAWQRVRLQAFVNSGERIRL